MSLLNEIFALAELLVKHDRIARVVYEINGKLHIELKENYSGPILKYFEYEPIEISKTKNKQKTNSSVSELLNSSSKDVFQDNGNAGFEISTTE